MSARRDDDLDDLSKIHREAERLHAPAKRRAAPAAERGAARERKPRADKRAAPRNRVATAAKPSAPADDPWVRAAAQVRRQEAEEPRRRSNRRPTDPDGWPSYSRAQSNDRRISDKAGWVLVGIAVLVLLFVIATAVFVIGRITGSIIVPPLPFA